MTPLLFVLRHNIHVAARFLFNFVFQSDPDALVPTVWSLSRLLISYWLGY